MSVKVGVYDKAVHEIAEPLDRLGLGIEILPYTADGRFIRDGASADPSKVDLHYLWFSPGLSRDGALDQAFDLALSLKSLDVLQTFNAGLDHPSYKKVADRGATICNSSAQAIAISEYVMAQVFALFHPIADQRRLQAEKLWQRTPFREIAGTNWLIIGYGPIGRATASRAKAFGANVSVIRRTPQAGPGVDRVGTMADLAELLPAADVVVLACPLNETTRGFAGTNFFSMVKTGAVLVNIARGGLIDDAALIEALDDGRLDHAVLDVFHTEPLPSDNPLWRHPKVRLTAHTSFAGDGVGGRWTELFLDNVARYARGEPLENRVDPADLT